MSTVGIGSVDFSIDLYAPVKGKTEWGMDTLTRKVQGWRSLAATYIATLKQGDPYYPVGVTNPYYLQSWDCDDGPNVATITLNYKGLVTGGTPIPKAITQMVPTVGQTEANYSTEGIIPGFSAPQGRYYRTDFIWSLTAPSSGPSDPGLSFKGERQRYALAARMDFVYMGVQTQYQYIAVGRPFGPRYVFPDIPYPSTLQRARITLNDGTVLPRTNWEIFFGLTPIPYYENISFECSPVIGSPFFECTEIARRTLGTPPS